jgi:hypothetical protein
MKFSQCADLAALNDLVCQFKARFDYQLALGGAAGFRRPVQIRKLILCRTGCVDEEIAQLVN